MLFICTIVTKFSFPKIIIIKNFLYIRGVMSSNNIDSQILANMKTHYSGLMKVGTTDFGGDLMSKTIFDCVNTDKSNGLTQAEIDAGMQNLDSYIKKSVENDSFYAEIHFGKSYTEAASKTDKTSSKTVSEQIIENNLKTVINQIIEYATKHPDDERIQKYANKLQELVDNNKIVLTDIRRQGVAGRAYPNLDECDEILIDNHDSINNLTPEYLLQTLLHELRHTLETDTLNSKAEEVATEKEAREITKAILEDISENSNTTKKLDFIRKKSTALSNKFSAVDDLQETLMMQGQDRSHFMFQPSLEEFATAYSNIAEASPGTYNIPKNTGIAVWYTPSDVVMDKETHTLLIKSDAQPDLKDAIIEDHVQFGDTKDEEGNPIPTSATRIIKDKDGNIIFEQDYGEYNSKKRSFDYKKMYMEQIKLKMNLNQNSFIEFGFS